jgi:hypothetical protein
MMKPSKQKIKPKFIFGFDTETYGNENTFLMGSLVSRNFLNKDSWEMGNKFVFWSKKEMQDFILNDKSLDNSLIFATNLGFDFLALFGDDVKLMSRFDWIVRGSEIVALKYKKANHKTIVFLDTMNFLKASVASLGKILNCPKLEKPSFLGKPVLRYSSKGKYLEEYNIRDSEISCRFADFLQESFNNLGTNIKYTIASTSISLFKSKYLKQWMQQPATEEIKEQYNAYYGGRVEAFYRGKLEPNKYRMFDINSLYPYVMQKYFYPNVNYFKVENKENNLYEDFEGLSYCEISTDNVKPIVKFYPFLPYRAEDKLLFPLGKWKGYYSHCELRYAKRLGYDIKPLKTHYYTADCVLFRDFVKDLYAKKLKYAKEKSPLSLVFKILLNSCYGKFSQRLEYTNVYFVQNEEHIKEIDIAFKLNDYREKDGYPPRFNIDFPTHKFRSLNDEEMKEHQKIVSRLDDTEVDGIKLDTKNPMMFEPDLYYITDMENEDYPHFINPIISIYTTAYARIELYDWYKYIYNKGGVVLYSDTDCLITDIDLPVGDEIGMLKNELGKDKIITKGIIIKPKMYYVESDEEIKSKAKGCKGIKEWNGFRNIIETQKVKYWKFSKFKESIKRDLAFNTKIWVRKDIDLEDNKRDWCSGFNPDTFQKSKPKHL